MKNAYFIKNYCHIKGRKVLLNGHAVFQSSESELLPFLKSVYKHLGAQHPKFFKMDSLSKLAFLAAEALLGNPEEATSATNMAVVLSNRASSLDTDRKHQESINDANNFYPSPAVFVYTLPNICIGEISIRHKLHSENSFFIFDQFNSEYLCDYSNTLLNDKKADEVLCGWAEVDKDNYEAFLYVVSSTGDYDHTKEEITRLYYTK